MPVFIEEEASIEYLTPWPATNRLDHTSEGAGTRVHPGQTFRRSKVGDLDHSTVSVHKDIVTLDVSVYDLVVMLATLHHHY